jgi:acyl-CoA synthetase (AMP-forming)/AMP-acid ligase II
LKGYYRNPEATETAFSNGWFHTGDVGYRDADGFFYIVDRKSDMIIRGGENIYPREIDEVLYQHPAVAAAATIGVPDNFTAKRSPPLSCSRRAGKGMKKRSSLFAARAWRITNAQRLFG